MSKTPSPKSQHASSPAESPTAPVSAEPEEAAAEPEMPTAAPELIGHVDKALAHLIEGGANAWKTEVLRPSEGWKDLYEEVAGELRKPLLAAQQDEEAPVFVQYRLILGAAPRELVMVVRILNTTYARAEVLPWTQRHQL